MAEEAFETSVASSSSVSANSWWEIPANSVATRSSVSQWPRPSLRSASSCDEDNISVCNTTSFTDVSPHSGLSMNSSSVGLSGEPVENHHLWNQVLLNVGSGGDMRGNHDDDDGENLLEVMTSKGFTPDEMFEPACDYLKKLDGSWEFENPLSLNSLKKQLGNYTGSTMVQVAGVTKDISEMVSNRSIAPPNPQLDRHVAPSACGFPITPPMAQYSTSNVAHANHEILHSPSYPDGDMARGRSTGHMSYYDRIIKAESHHQDMGAAATSFLRNGVGYHQVSAVGLDNKFCAAGTSELPWTSTRSLSDLISFSGCLNKLPVDVLRPSRPYLKGSDSSDTRKHGHDSSSTRGNGMVSGASEGKKKRSEESSETVSKKSKHENSAASSLKLQAPKVRLADKITALQQLVSPFGKTDTASVLLETINCIRVLQEQVQLLSDPFMKSSASKDHSSWGEMERKEKAEAKLDLRSKGLCLVPISCIPQVHRENCGPDYWMPTFRACLYR
ncbi:transcription factor bHLH110-like [Musa acuminata AAA Group]|uniref:transcription factor bHLH110-like n=1 Tax=Musa acuminata AAA Group TaxID=214697 RepID=UPI0031DEAB0E